MQLADFSLEKRRYDDSFEVSAEMEEDGTGRLTFSLHFYTANSQQNLPQDVVLTHRKNYIKLNSIYFSSI